MKQRPFPGYFGGDDAMLAGFSAVPVGAVIAFAGKLSAGADGKPDRISHAIEAWGWMHCDGRMLSKALYPELFAFIGHQYDDGTTNGQFGIPDYRGLFMRGVDGGANKDPEAAARKPVGSGAAGEAGSHQGDALRHHQHGPAPGGTDTVELAAPNANMVTGITTGGAMATPPAGVSAAETRPVNIAVHYLIRFTVKPRHALRIPL